jgi:DNA processing protein
VNLEELSPAARGAFAAVSRDPRSFDQLLDATRISSGALTSALCELELVGLVVQRPGKRYERI